MRWLLLVVAFMAGGCASTDRWHEDAEGDLERAFPLSYQRCLDEGECR